MVSHINQRRLILDGLLVLAVVAALFSYHEPWHVNAEQQVQSTAVTENSNQDFGQPIAETTTISGTEAAGDAVILDNETIAAVIAAENAALTPPQFMTGLPVIAR
jgi:hypothetical protein